MELAVMDDGADPGREAFLSEVRRLRSDVRAAAQVLDRLEAEMRRLLDDLIRQRFEGKH